MQPIATQEEFEIYLKDNILIDEEGDVVVDIRTYLDTDANITDKKREALENRYYSYGQFHNYRIPELGIAVADATGENKPVRRVFGARLPKCECGESCTPWPPAKSEYADHVLSQRTRNSMTGHGYYGYTEGNYFHKSCVDCARAHPFKHLQQRRFYYPRDPKGMNRYT